MADSPVLFVYYRPDNDDAYPGVPARHITEADWASFTIAQRRTIENATTQEGYTRRKVWVHRDLVDETEEERAQREAAEAAARAEYDRKNSLVRYGQIEAMIDQLEVLPPAEEFAALRADVDAVAEVPAQVEAVTPGRDETVVGGPDGPVSVEHKIHVRAYGPDLPLDGTGDWTAAINAALADWHASGGGTLVFPPGILHAAGQITVPNDGAADPGQPAMRWEGAGAWMAGRGHKGHTPNGGTILRLSYAGPAVARLITLGQGMWEITGITFEDTSGSTVPFLRTTGTTLKVHQCAFIGSKSTIYADLDAIVLGGKNIGTGDVDNTPEGPFQGYGTVIADNFFDGIRRGVHGQMYANNVVVRDNTFWARCGDNTNGGAGAIDFNPPPTPGGQGVFGNVISGNLIEMLGYRWGIRLERSSVNTLDGNSFFDPGVNAEACVRMAGTGGRIANLNLVIAGFNGGGGTPLPYLSEETPGANTIIDTNYQAQSRYISPVRFEKAVRAYGTGEASTTNIEFSDSATKAVFKTQGTVWAREGTGGNLTVDTGAGGSSVDLKGYRVRFYRHTGQLAVTAMEGKDGFAFGPSSDVNLYRRTTDQLRTDDRLLASLGIGVGNTAAATTPGTVVRKMPVYNEDGDTILGYVPLYDSIT